MSDSADASDSQRPGASATRASTPGRRVGIRAQTYAGLFGSVLLVTMASVVAYVSLNQVVKYQSRLAEDSIPNLSRAVEVARQSTNLVQSVVRMVAASTPEEHQSVANEVLQGRQELNRMVAAIGALEYFSEQAEALSGRLDMLETLLNEISDSSSRRLDIRASLDVLVDELGVINKRLERSTGASIDDQGFFLATGLRDLDDVAEPLSQRDWEPELAHYRDLIEINHQTTLAGLLLGEALVLADRDLLGPIEERFQSAALSILRVGGRLAARPDQAGLVADMRRLVEIGSSVDGVLALRRETLERLERETAALEDGREASTLLLADMEELVGEVNRQAVAVNTESQEAAATGIVLLVALTLVSVIGAVLIGWLFVGRHLIRRLVELAKNMRDMAGGDLEVPVTVTGNDEVTDMANALEVFRRYALEVQRLNLVEKLAQELDAKNQDLEQAMERLRKAQEQIVAEEKLASLGQLTAGVAHEIKNPLNFVNNFAEVSAELVDEIGEILEEAGDDQSDAVEEVEDVLDDLRVNLGKIREHSGRADGIVRNMLEHSRAEPGDWRETDLNALVKQYRDLAYHAIRAENTDFNVTMSDELDDKVGMVEVVPQDISRAFLNILTNACQAIEEKCAELGSDYDPELGIASRRLNDSVEFTIRDNGPGIPPELRQRMFEPFVTTKDTGKGTGLGLSLTADIITRHGGHIDVDSEVGVFTEFRIRLPLEPTRAPSPE
ncbi:MAG: HAMP domain-containing protein [Gammaproteobacteria bacterium]|nr:ATP-binding protein [Gammaproteobacteria bacterium]MYF29286.1 HAMP domain-containing protein [Gammaproteobacteria bacterium]MYK46866.1 HAMP domain-containing protein [Gammaproteobacteria bacterium]